MALEIDNDRQWNLCLLSSILLGGFGIAGAILSKKVKSEELASGLGIASGVCLVCCFIGMGYMFYSLEMAEDISKEKFRQDALQRDQDRMSMTQIGIHQEMKHVRENEFLEEGSSALEQESDAFKKRKSWKNKRVVKLRNQLNRTQCLEADIKKLKEEQGFSPVSAMSLDWHANHARLFKELKEVVIQNKRLEQGPSGDKSVPGIKI